MSKWTVVFTTLLSAIIGGLIAAGIFIAVALKTDILTQSKADVYGAGAGYKMLTDFQCRYGETKHILMNGVDDNFALGNQEPGRISERLAHLPGHPVNNPYQRKTRIEKREQYGNDFIGIGNFLNTGPKYPITSYNSFGSWLNEFSSVPNWDSQTETSTIEVIVGDDTGVDFTGMAACTAPDKVMGMTFTKLKLVQKEFDNFQVMVCDSELTAYPCNPIYGDTVCTESLPLACFKDTGEPAPELDENASKSLKGKLSDFWGGGDIEFTGPVRGDEFQTLQDANQLCEAEFGFGWRVLDYHDGGIKSVASLKSSNTPESRVWVDIKDQAKGTCWSRDKTASTRLGAAE